MILSKSDFINIGITDKFLKLNKVHIEYLKDEVAPEIFEIVRVISNSPTLEIRHSAYIDFSIILKKQYKFAIKTLIVQCIKLTNGNIKYIKS